MRLCMIVACVCVWLWLSGRCGLGSVCVRLEGLRQQRIQLYATHRITSHRITSHRIASHAHTHTHTHTRISTSGMEWGASELSLTISLSLMCRPCSRAPPAVRPPRRGPQGVHTHHMHTQCSSLSVCLLSVRPPTFRPCHVCCAEQVCAGDACDWSQDARGRRQARQGVGCQVRRGLPPTHTRKPLYATTGTYTNSTPTHRQTHGEVHSILSLHPSPVFVCVCVCMCVSGHVP